MPVALIDDVAGHAKARDERGGAAADHIVDLVLEPLWQGGEQVDPEGPRRGLAHGGDLAPHFVVAHCGRTQAAEAAGLRHGGGQAVIGHAAHAGEHHGMLDLQGVGQAGPEHARMLAKP